MQECTAEILTDVGKWILAVIAVEAITEIIVASEIMFGLRAYIASKSDFLGKLFTCGYCMSVWVAMLSAAYFLPGDVIPNQIANFVVKGMVLHRLSNILHGFVKIITDRPPIYVVMSKVNGGSDDGR